MKWYLGAFKKYVDFHGRARRKEYWFFFLFNMIVAIALADYTLLKASETALYRNVTLNECKL